MWYYKKRILLWLSWLRLSSFRKLKEHVSNEEVSNACLPVCLCLVWTPSVFCVAKRNVASMHSLISRARKQLFSTDYPLCEDMLQPCSSLMSRSNVVINMVLSTTRLRAELFSDWCCYCHHLNQDLSTSSLTSSMFLQVEVIGAMIKPAYLIPGRFHWAARPLLLWGCQLWSGIKRTLSPPQRTSMSKC